MSGFCPLPRRRALPSSSSRLHDLHRLVKTRGYTCIATNSIPRTPLAVRQQSRKKINFKTENVMCSPNMKATRRLPFRTYRYTHLPFASTQRNVTTLAASKIPFKTQPQARHESNSAQQNKDTSNYLTSNEGTRYSLQDEECNVPPTIACRLGMDLHLQENHPLQMIKTTIERYWNQQGTYNTFDTLSPIVSTYNNFDSLLIEPDHVSRSKSDTYYVNDKTVLRTHTSAHQLELLQQGYDKFLVTGDVYRRDEIDACHYPIFHQMEGVHVFKDDELPPLHSSFSSKGASYESKERIQFVEEHLKHHLEGMARELFGHVEMRWVDAYFPFTDPSYELEIYYNDEWLEVLGCGVIQQAILAQASSSSSLHDADATPSRTPMGWAFGLGLERLAMVLFSIPDIRLFWSTDERFTSQFETGKMDVTFVPYSKYPPCYKDISFWLPESGTSLEAGKAEDSKTGISTSGFHANDLNEGVRAIAGDLVESVQLIDDFVHPKTQRTSHCYRINYRSMDRNLTNEEVDVLQAEVRKFAEEELGVDLR